MRLWVTFRMDLVNVFGLHLLTVDKKKLLFIEYQQNQSHLLPYFPVGLSYFGIWWSVPNNFAVAWIQQQKMYKSSYFGGSERFTTSATITWWHYHPNTLCRITAVGCCWCWNKRSRVQIQNWLTPHCLKSPFLFGWWTVNAFHCFNGQIRSFKPCNAAVL